MAQARDAEARKALAEIDRGDRLGMMIGAMSMVMPKPIGMVVVMMMTEVVSMIVIVSVRVGATCDTFGEDLIARGV